MDRTITTLTASMKAIDDVIIPALDVSDPLAQEQAGLVLEYLGFLRDRVEYLHSRALIELDDAYLMLVELLPQIEEREPSLADVASGELVACRSLLKDSTALSTQLQHQTARVLAVIRNFVRSADSDDSASQNTRRSVSEVTERSEVFYRAWFAPLGFDQHSQDLPVFEDALEQRLAGIDKRLAHEDDSEESLIR